MIFRVTRKVSSKLRIAYAAIADSHLSMVEWYCNLVTVRRRQFFLFTHAASLFSFWVPAAGSTRASFGQGFRQHAIDTFRDYGFASADIAKVIDDGPDVFARAADRGVTGSMVDYAKMLRHAVAYEGSLERLGPRAMNDLANDSPMRKIGMESPAEYLRKFSAPTDRITSRCTGPGLALLAPAAERCVRQIRKTMSQPYPTVEKRDDHVECAE